MVNVLHDRSYFRGVVNKIVSVGRRKKLTRIFRFLGKDILLQALAFIIGLMVIRFLAKEQYALYAAYMSVLFAITFLSESGISNILLSVLSYTDKSASSVSKVFNSGMKYRLKSGIFSSIVAFVAIYILMVNYSASKTEIVFSGVLIIISLYAVMYRSNYQFLYRYLRRPEIIQNILFCGTAIRLTLLPLVAFVPSEWQLLYLLSSTAASYWIETYMYHKISKNRIDKRLGIDPKSTTALRKASKRLLPTNLLTVGREQVLVFLISVMGSAVIFADIMALSRFSIAFAVLNSMVYNIVVPKIANDKQNIALRNILATTGLYALIATIAVIAIVVCAPILLWLLGSEYAHLRLELIVVTIGAALLNITTMISQLGQARNWVAGWWVLALGTALWAGAGTVFLDLNTSMGGAIFLASQCVPALLMEAYRLIVGNRRSLDGADIQPTGTLNKGTADETH